MAQRVGILNGANLAQDKDFGGIVDALTPATTGIILENGLAVTTNTVAVGRCLIQCTRTSTTPNESVWVVFENTSAVTISTAGTSKVWIAIDQTRINDGSLNTDITGAGIGVITVGANYPASNYIPLAVITAGVIADARPSLVLNSFTVQGIMKHTMGTPIASATTTDLSTVVGNKVHITGVTTINSFGILPAGTEMCVIFDSALTLTYNATSMKIPGGVSVTTATDDIAYLISEGAGNWRVIYQKANGQSLSASTDVHGLTLSRFLKSGDEFVTWNAVASANRKTTPNSIFVDYGDGSDGFASISTTVTLTRDMYYTTLTVTGTGILKTAGYRVFASTSVTIQTSGQVVVDEVAGGNASGITGGTATAITTSGSTSTARQGTAGANGTTYALSRGSSPTYTDTANFSSFVSAVGTSGGTGGNSGYGYGGGGSGACPISNSKGPIASFGFGKSEGFTALGMPGIMQYRFASPNGGGSGGNYCSGSPTGGGGSGGNNAGGLFIASPSINNAGIISANGGKGGTGGNASATTNNNGTNGGGGGGGGGCGGNVFLLTEALTNTSGIIRANGGNGGNGGSGASAGNGGAVGGNGGQAGNGGSIVLPTGYTGTVTVNAGTVGSGGAVSGAAWAGSAGSAGSAGIISTY